MKKILYIRLLISLIVLAAPASSLAQTKDASTDPQVVSVMPVRGVCPNDYVLSKSGEECVKPSIPSKTPIAPSEGSKDSNGGNTVLIAPVDGICPENYALSADGKECLKSSKVPTAPSRGIKDVTGVSFLIAPIDGKCPENHLISDDSKTCLKLDVKVPSAPLEGSKNQVEVSFTSPTPIDGKCLDGYVVSVDGKECSKILPTIVIAPKEGFKEVIFESGGKTTIKDNNIKKATTITAKDGFGIIVSVESGGATQIKEVTVESRVSSGETKISTGEVSASTKESMEVKENKVFLKQKEVKIMPDEANGTAITSAGLTSVAMTELKTEEQKPVYLVQGNRSSKLLFFIPVSIETIAKIDASSGDVISVKKPWWSFLAW